jgi:hypothetical protein
MKPINQIIKEEIQNIFEVGEGNMQPYKFAKIMDKPMIKFYQFFTETYEYAVSIKTINKIAWTISFGNESPVLVDTNEGEQYKIMSTILQIVKEFVNEENPICITFSSVKTRGEGDNRRDNMYMAYVGKNMPSDYEYIKNSGNSNIIRKKITSKIINDFKRLNTDGRNIDEITIDDYLYVYPEMTNYLSDAELNNLYSVILIYLITTDPKILKRIKKSALEDQIICDILIRRPDLMPYFDLNIDRFFYCFVDNINIIEYLTPEQKQRLIIEYREGGKYLKRQIPADIIRLFEETLDIQ